MSAGEWILMTMIVAALGVFIAVVARNVLRLKKRAEALDLIPTLKASIRDMENPREGGTISRETAEGVGRIEDALTEKGFTRLKEMKAGPARLRLMTSSKTGVYAEIYAHPDEGERIRLSFTALAADGRVLSLSNGRFPQMLKPGYCAWRRKDEEDPAVLLDEFIMWSEKEAGGVSFRPPSFDDYRETILKVRKGMLAAAEGLTRL